MERSSFVFYKDWMEALKDLPDDIRLEVYEGIIEYATTGNIKGLKPMARIAFNFVKTTIDRDTERYSSVVERNKKNGSSGGRPRNPEKPKEPTGFSGNPKKPKKPDNDNDNDSDNDSEKRGKILEAARAAALQREKDFCDSLTPFTEQYGETMLQEFFDYWSEKNKSQTKMRFEQQATWELGRRLATWARKEDKFSAKTQKNDHSRAAKAKTVPQSTSGYRDTL